MPGVIGASLETEWDTAQSLGELSFIWALSRYVVITTRFGAFWAFSIMRFGLELVNDILAYELAAKTMVSVNDGEYIW